MDTNLYHQPQPELQRESGLGHGHLVALGGGDIVIPDVKLTSSDDEDFAFEIEVSKAIVVVALLGIREAL